MKTKNLFEHFKTIILAVLFVITILLLYLCFTQDGRSFNMAEILGTQNRGISISVDDYLLPEYSLKANADGSYNLSFENKKEVNRTVLECAKNLISSSTAKLVVIDENEFNLALRKENSIEEIFSFAIPFKGFSEKLLGSSLEAPEGCKFNVIMFSDSAKECFFLRDFSGNYYKVVSGENYYSIDRILSVYQDGTDILKESYGIYDIEKVIAELGNLAEAVPLEYENVIVAENVFGDNFDFVRRITDNFGNETYMYGYGQKRLSFYAEEKSVEFKEEIAKGGNPNFYNDLETSLLFIASAFNLEDMNLKLISADLTDHYKFVMEINGNRFTTEVVNSKLSYLEMKQSD